MNPDEKREPKERKKWEFPDTYVLIAALLFLAVLATWVLPAGSYERVYDEAADRDVVQAGTYAAVESNPASIGDFFLAVPQGLVKNASTVFFIFIIGGCFGVVNRTGALTGSSARPSGGVRAERAAGNGSSYCCCWCSAWPAAWWAWRRSA